MPWISVAGDRARLRAAVAVTEKYRQQGLGVATYDFSEHLEAVLSGEDAALHSAAKMALAVLPWPEADKARPAPEILPNAINLAIVASFAGYDPEPLFARIAAAKTYPAKEETARALQRIVRQIVDANTDLELAGEPALPGSNEKWVDLVFDGPADQALDLALTPDHERWALIRIFAMPLAWLIASRGGDRSSGFLALARNGPFEERRGSILHEGSAYAADLLIAPAPGKPRTVFGFDAVEKKDGAILIYHYPGCGARAADVMERVPPLFEQFDQEWERVGKALAKTRDDARHVIVYRATGKALPQSWLDDMATRYDIDVTAADVTQV